MIIKNIRKKLIFCGVMFLLAGFVTGLIGFGIGGFDLSVLEEAGSPVWYRTIHVDDGRLWFGMEIKEGFFIMRLLG